MGKNRLFQTGWLILLVMGVLLLMRALPSMRVGGHALRRVDILSDLRPPKIRQAPVLAKDTVWQQPADTVRSDTVSRLPVDEEFEEGEAIIEDFSGGNPGGMDAFYRALQALESHPRTVRIAYLGDSFIEGDIMTSDLRYMLQQRFGGRGVGFVPITSISSGFRRTVRHSFSGWNSHSIIDSVYFNRRLQDLSNHYFEAGSHATVRLSGVNDYDGTLAETHRARLYLYNRDTVSLSVSVNGGEHLSRTVAPAGGLHAVSVGGPVRSVQWNVLKADSTLFYGLALEDTTGIILDNYSMRGASGTNLGSVPLKILGETNRCRPYDLLVLQYGVNVASNEVLHYDYYVRKMATTLEHLKQAFPQASILIVGVADRDYRTEEGDILTMPGIRALVHYQQKLATEQQVAFWNLYKAMGGSQSMKRMVEARPSQANLDYTHINFRGGKKLAGLLYDALLKGFDEYRQGGGAHANP